MPTSTPVTDKPAKRLVTVLFLVLAILYFLFASNGYLGHANRVAAWPSFGVMLLIALGRAILTETGVRRPRRKPST